jgi:hypothetical protein
MSDRDDPFAPEADPDLPAVAPVLTVARRTALQLVVAGCAVASSGCAPRRLACTPASPAGETCQHRFCRHYRA